MKAVLLMQFGETQQKVYEAMCSACGQQGVEAIRIDHVLHGAGIRKAVFCEICDADFVIVDTSGNRPNVMYELAVSHVLRKPVIHISDRATEIPFYLGDLTIHQYEWRNDREDYVMTGKDMSLTAFLGDTIDKLAGSMGDWQYPMDPALGTDLLKVRIPWLSGYRKTYVRESSAREVWLFERSFHWEVSGGSVQEMKEAGILSGQRRYKYLMSKGRNEQRLARTFWDCLWKRASTDEERTNIVKSLEFRFDSPDVFDFLPCSVVLFDPELRDTCAVLMEPMKNEPGGDVFDQKAGCYSPDSIPPHLEFLESTYDIVLDMKQVARYRELFKRRWAKAAPPGWMQTPPE